MAPTASSGTPSTASPVRLMYSNAPASGAATQGPTISAESTPIRNTAATLPPWSRPPAFASRLCIDVGSCSSYTPNIESANSTKIAAKPPSTHGFCREADSSVPARPAATPASA